MGCYKTETASIHCKLTNIQARAQVHKCTFPRIPSHNSKLALFQQKKNKQKQNKTKHPPPPPKNPLKTNVDATALATIGVNLYKSCDMATHVLRSQTHIMPICYVHFVVVSTEEKSQMMQIRSH